MENVIISILVAYPEVLDPSRFIACSVVLQRGVIVFKFSGVAGAVHHATRVMAQRSGEYPSNAGGNSWPDFTLLLDV